MDHTTRTTKQDVLAMWALSAEIQFQLMHLNRPDLLSLTYVPLLKRFPDLIQAICM